MQAQGGILHQPLGIRTGMTGDLGQLRFLLRGEMDFHACQCGRASLCCQRARWPRACPERSRRVPARFLRGNVGIASVCANSG